MTKFIENIFSDGSSNIHNVKLNSLIQLTQHSSYQIQQMNSIKSTYLLKKTLAHIVIITLLQEHVDNKHFGEGFSVYQIYSLPLSNSFNVLQLM